MLTMHRIRHRSLVHAPRPPSVAAERGGTSRTL